MSTPFSPASSLFPASYQASLPLSPSQKKAKANTTPAPLVEILTRCVLSRRYMLNKAPRPPPSQNKNSKVYIRFPSFSLSHPFIPPFLFVHLFLSSSLLSFGVVGGPNSPPPPGHFSRYFIRFLVSLLFFFGEFYLLRRVVSLLVWPASKGIVLASSLRLDFRVPHPTCAYRAVERVGSTPSASPTPPRVPSYDSPASRGFLP